MNWIIMTEKPSYEYSFRQALVIYSRRFTNLFLVILANLVLIGAILFISQMHLALSAILIIGLLYGFIRVVIKYATVKENLRYKPNPYSTETADNALDTNAAKDTKRASLSIEHPVFTAENLSYFDREEKFPNQNDVFSNMSSDSNRHTQATSALSHSDIFVLLRSSFQLIKNNMDWLVAIIILALMTIMGFAAIIAVGNFLFNL